VSRDAGKPYCDKLLKLPAFLLDDAAPIGEGDIAAGFILTGHFIERDVLEPHGLSMPQARERLIAILARPSKAARSA
jgi:DNA repair protein RecO (recombination protein O)